jgi:hypothetical protein
MVLYSDGATREAEEASGGAARGAAESYVLDVSFAAEASIEVVIYIVPYPEPQPSGVQGWSISVAHDREVMDLQSATTDGTDADSRMRGGYAVTEEADGPGSGGGRSAGEGAGEDEAGGFVSAGVMSFRLPVTLDPTRAQSIARATYLASDRLGASSEAPAFIRFADG